MTEPQEIEQPIRPEGRLSNRIGNAIRRENEEISEESETEMVSEENVIGLEPTESSENTIIDRMTWTTSNTAFQSPRDL